MDFKVIWADSAIENLREICFYIAENNSSAAKRIGQAILDHAKILASFPTISAKYDQLKALALALHDAGVTNAILINDGAR